MSPGNRILFGCLVLPVALVASCYAKVAFDHRMYVLPGEVLKSSATPTRKLTSAMQVAETLDAYVQPRFEILRDKNFGAMRIVFKKHAGVVQLKVESPKERELIANVNATGRDYAICLLHCAPKPESSALKVIPRLELLYFNQQAIATDWDNRVNRTRPDDAATYGLDWPKITLSAEHALHQLTIGQEKRTSMAKWDILMRPVLASNQECLSCHKNAKQGDTLGVMVYAVRADKESTSLKMGLR